MSKLVVKKDKVVSLTYALRNERGEIVEYSDMPVSYVHGGSGDLFPEIEQVLEGCAIGDKVTVSLAPAQAFGAHKPELTFTDDIDNVPTELRRLGAQLEAENDKGETLTFVVTRIDNGKLTIDANHPLAGQHVTFIVTVNDIRDATAEEIRAGRPGAPSGPPLQ